MLSAGVAAFVNHLLAAAPAARERLVPFAGRTARFVLPPLPDLHLNVRPDGTVADTDSAEAQLVVTLTPASLVALARRDEAALRSVTFSGDAELAAALQHAARQVDWDVEEDLSRLLGDVAAHRIAGAARDLTAWQKDAAVRAGQNVAEYLTEEAALVAGGPELAAFSRDVAELRDAVERLEKRVESVERQAPASR